MDSFDATTWQAVGVTLTLVGLVVSALVWRRRGPVSGLRASAWALLPAAAGLTGTLRLLWQIGDDVATWAVRLVLSPVVWLGLTLAGVSVALFVVSAALRSRSRGRPAGGSGRSGSRAAGRPDRDAVAGSGDAGSAGRLPATSSRQRAEPAVKDEDMDDIEAILRRHGIS